MVCTVWKNMVQFHFKIGEWLNFHLMHFKRWLWISLNSEGSTVKHIVRSVSSLPPLPVGVALQPGEDSRGAVSRAQRDQVVWEWLRGEFPAGEEVLRSAHCQHPGQERGMVGRAHAGTFCWRLCMWGECAPNRNSLVSIVHSFETPYP